MHTACMLFLAVLLHAGSAQAREVNIGVLAMRGHEMADRMWSPTADYLAQRLPGHTFRVMPLGFDEIELAVRQRRVDFVLANPSFYVQLELLYGVSPVVTMRNRHNGSEGYGVFGGVLFTRADHGAVRKLQDLKGRSFAAVDQGSFGGWHAGWREMLRHGLNPERDFSALHFLGTHDAVVLAVLEGVVDAGTARTETIERMAAEGRLDPSRLFVLNEQHTASFPLRHSTPLYPEWPLARVQGVPERLAVDVAVALMMMSPDDPAAIASQTMGWTLPLNYQPVHQALRELRIGPYEHLRHLSLREVLAQYWHWIAITLLALALALLTVAYIGRTNRRLRLHQLELRELNAGLENRVLERTQRVELLLDRERFLRGIVEMVADVNEILITAQSRDEMLKACCDRLVAHPDYRFAWVNLVHDGQLQLAAKSYGTSEFVRLMDDCGDGPGERALRENRTVTQRMHDRVLTGGVSVYAVCALPLRKDVFSEPVGVLCVFTVRDGGFDAEEVAMLEQLAGDMGFATAAFEQREETVRLQHERINHYEKTILSLVDLVERRDTYTAGHTRRVADYCSLLARELGLPQHEIDSLRQAAVLHDIGKIAIPDSVLLKPGPLTDAEFALIKQHVNVGYDTLRRIDMYRDLAEIMRHHHERYDGSGYPLGVAGEAIPFASRIMAVADAFDAMTTNRIYRPRKPVAQAVAEIESLSGRHFDPQVVQAVARALGDIQPPPLADQLPKSPLERQRLAYFFNDPLTGVHNGSYLEFMLRHRMLENLNRVTLVLLRNFSSFNDSEGWRSGNQALAAFARGLGTLAGEAPVFRVTGDDFLILSASELPLDADQLLAQSVFAGTAVRIELECFPLDQIGLQRLKALL
ncbi:MAG: HD domain-containing phosphohydrolase [Rhodocyclaceae bacterium]